MRNETQQANGLVALMAVLGGQDGGWTLIEKGGELYIVPATGRRAGGWAQGKLGPVIGAAQ